VSDGYRRNAELARAAMMTAAGAAVIALSQQAAVAPSAGQAILVVGGVVVALGLVFAVRSLLGRRGDADQ
jgi:hypothetical protein